MISELLFLGLTMVLPLTAISAADDTGTVSIVGQNVDESDYKVFGLTLAIANAGWIEAESGNHGHFFKTKKGSYVRINNVVSLLDGKKKEVGRLNNLIPESAKKGAGGTGYAEETGISFVWQVV